MIEITEQPFSEGLKKQIFDGFSSHALATIGHDEKFDSLAFVAMDGNAVIGSVVVESFWGALHIKLMYVEEAYRNKGVGRRLMERALAYGVKKGCPFAFVETMSFQALDFYRKVGFQLEFTRSGYSHGTSFHYMRKDLIA